MLCTYSLNVKTVFNIKFFHKFSDEPEAQNFEMMSPENVGSPMEPAYMSDGEYEAISSEDEFIDIDADVVRSLWLPNFCFSSLLNLYHD